MVNKRFHYLVANRDDIHQADNFSHLRKWKITGREILSDIVAILITEYLPSKPLKRTDTWVLLCSNYELAVIQQNWEKPIYFVAEDENVSKYFNASGDVTIYLQLLIGKDKESYFHNRGLHPESSQN